MPRRHYVLFGDCKLFGHAWEEQPQSNAADLNGWHGRLDLRCTRCSTTRVDFIDYTGELGGRKYEYPKGYRDTRDEKPSRAALRLMMVKR